MDSFGYIYKVTNTLNGRIYIGQKQGSINPSYLGSGIAISKAVQKYGKEFFRLEIISFATTKPMLDGLEMKLIYEYRQVFGKEFLYNITDGGDGFRGERTPEIIEKMKTSLGKKHSQERIEKIRQSVIKSKAKGMPDEERRNLSLRMRGNKNTLGKKHSVETKEKIRKALMGNKNCVGRVLSKT